MIPHFKVLLGVHGQVIVFYNAKCLLQYRHNFLCNYNSTFFTNRRLLHQVNKKFLLFLSQWISINERKQQKRSLSPIVNITFYLTVKKNTFYKQNSRIFVVYVINIVSYVADKTRKDLSRTKINSLLSNALRFITMSYYDSNSVQTVSINYSLIKFGVTALSNSLPPHSTCCDRSISRIEKLNNFSFTFTTIYK